jgi:RNA polymerase sigma-70 factor (ECF subfamily)
MGEDSPEFVQLLMKNQRRIYAFIRSQVRSPADADDVMQETSTILWTKFEKFEQGTDFARWACRIARLEVLTHLRHRRRLAPLFAEPLADDLADAVLDEIDSVGERHQALAGCLGELPDDDRTLVMERYEPDATVKQMAERRQRSESAIYKAITRIHNWLFNCIERKLSEQERDHTTRRGDRS